MADEDWREDRHGRWGGPYGPDVRPDEESMAGGDGVVGGLIVDHLTGRAPIGFRPRGPKGYRRADASIREEICETLTHHPELDARAVEITVENGEVTLEGTVHDRRQKRGIEDVAHHARGVRDVHNRIRWARR